MLLRSHYKSRPGSECCLLKLMRFHVQGSELGPSLATSCQHAAHCGVTAPSRREAAGSQEGSWSAVRLLRSALHSQGALQDPQPTRPCFPHRHEMGGGESSNDSLPGIQNSSCAKDTDKHPQAPSAFPPLLSQVWPWADQNPAYWDKQLLFHSASAISCPASC